MFFFIFFVDARTFCVFSFFPLPWLLPTPGARPTPAPNIDIMIKDGKEEREGEYNKGAAVPANIIDYFEREKGEYGSYPLNKDTDIIGIEMKGALAPNTINFNYDFGFKKEENEYDKDAAAPAPATNKFFEKEREEQFDKGVLAPPPPIDNDYDYNYNIDFNLNNTKYNVEECSCEVYCTIKTFYSSSLSGGVSSRSHSYAAIIILSCVALTIVILLLAFGICDNLQKKHYIINTDNSIVLHGANDAAAINRDPNSATTTRAENSKHFCHIQSASPFLHFVCIHI